MSIFTDIFGGGSQTSQSSSTSTSTPTNMNPFTSSLGGVVNAMGSAGLPTFNGPLAAGASGNENSILDTLMKMQGQGGGVPGTGGYLSSVLAGNFLPGQPGGNPFLNDMITAAQRTTMNNLTDTLSRALPGQFTRGGQFTQPNDGGQGGSSAFDMAAALASRGAATAMGDIATNIAGGQFAAERQNQQQAAALSQQEVSTTIANLQAQALPRMIQQLGIQNGLQLFQTNMQGILQLLATLGNITQPVIGNQQNATSTATGTATTTPGILPDVTNMFKAAFPLGMGGGKIG